MKFRFLSFFRYTLLAVVVASLAVISGCDDDDDGDGGPTHASIMELIQDDQFKQSATVPATQALDSVAKYLSAYGVDALLAGSDKTLFAPSNQAFVNLLTTTPGFPSNIESISPNIIAGVLAYHIVASKNLKADLTSGTTLNTLFSQPDNCNPTGGGEVQVITINADGTLLTGSSNAEIEITSADNLTTTDGVVHVTESVLIPPSIGATLPPLLTTIAGPVLLSSDFSIMAGLMTYADCAITNPTTTPPLTNILANPDGTYTVFFPPNAVFAGAGLGDTVGEVIASLAGAGLDTPEEIRGLILGHIVPTGDMSADELSDAAPTTLTAMNTQQIEVSLNRDVIILNGETRVAVADAAARGNGTLHAIGGILGM